ncbi:MAG: hypothetical protein A3I43_01745 [Omnitrophica WOR_2 bacterium RIFCSPLOWO2_02_FULL_50_19]|nr:MAG: hypothetical protein A3I43_01745 [Omnitrophica WOR_2 bacterium RIFCSPLOWO2_02_FULL_50_19]
MIKVGIVTISDSCSKKTHEDESGPMIKKMVEAKGLKVERHEIVPDEREAIKSAVINMVDVMKLDMVLTTGGTGIGPRDVTPEAVKPLLDKELPGVSEQIRRIGAQNSPRAILSRGLAGVRRQSLIVNLPGSPRGVEESLNAILDVLIHSVDMIHGKGH